MPDAPPSLSSNSHDVEPDPRHRLHQDTVLESTQNSPRPVRSRKRKAIFLAIVVTLAYPAFVLVFTWTHVARSSLPGGRNGPLDAYRHTLASAVVSYTLSPGAVELATWFLEGSKKDSDRMDRHNNRIGAEIGAQARSFAEIEATVRARVARGAVDATDASQIRWLSPDRWRAGLFR